MNSYKKAFPEIFLFNEEEKQNYLQDTCGCLQPPCQVDKINKKEKKRQAKNFFTFNGILIAITVILGLISNFIPSSKKPQIKEGILRNHVFPLIYFCIFSFFFGAIFVVGLDKVKPFLLFYLNNIILDVAFIAAYTAVFSLLIAGYIKTIISKSLGFPINGSSIHDIIGFTLGRIILLILVSLGLLGYSNLQS